MLKSNKVFTFDDGYYLAVAILRCVVLTLMAMVILTRTGLDDSRASLVVLFLALQIFWELRNKPPTMSPLVVMIVRNKNYVNYVAGITVALKIRTACLGGDIEPLSEDEKRVVEYQIHARLSPEMAKKVMRLRPVANICLAFYQQYIKHSQGGEIDYRQLAPVLITSAPELIQFWYAEEDVEENNNDSSGALVSDADANTIVERKRFVE